MSEKRKYWIHKEVSECVLCGKTEIYRERRYTPKPKDWYERNSYLSYGCYSCQYQMFM